MSKPSNISLRLLAHARLCREIARASWNEDMAQKLEWLAEDCLRAAKHADAGLPPQTAFDRLQSARATG
jgi:hypothetical protein